MKETGTINVQIYNLIKYFYNQYISKNFTIEFHYKNKCKYLIHFFK